MPSRQRLCGICSKNVTVFGNNELEELYNVTVFVNDELEEMNNVTVFVNDELEELNSGDS